MPSTNKVKYGLKNVHYAKATIAADGTATYGTVKPWPGAVNLSLDAQGDTTKFRADNIDYWVGQSNNGYSGDFESALIPEDFRKDILGDITDANGALVEDAGAKTEYFALLFQFEGDQKNIRHVLYNCSITRPSVSGQTTAETIEPQTESVTLTAASIHSNALDKDIIKARASEDEAAVYAAWFDAVYQPAPAKPVTGITITGTATVAKDSTTQLTATVTPADATNKKVTWTSSDEAVATVDSTGLVTGVAAGTATITATAQDGSGVSDTESVTVTAS